MFTRFLVPVLHARYLRYYIDLSQFVQFVEDHVRLLECSPASCLAPRNHSEEKREKFITAEQQIAFPLQFWQRQAQRRILKSQRGHIFSFGWMKNIFSREKTSSFERNTIVSHLPAWTLEVFWRLSHSFFLIKWHFLVLATFHFVQRHPTCMFHRKPAKTEIYLDSFLRLKCATSQFWRTISHGFN